MQTKFDEWLHGCTTRYAASETEALRDVVRWEWSRGVICHPLPLGVEREPKRGKVVPTPKAPRDGLIEHGLDKEGRVVLARAYQSRGAKGLLFRVLLVKYDVNGLQWSWHAENPARTTQEAGVVRFANAVAESSELLSNHGHVTETYEHDSAGRITRILVEVTQNWRRPKDSKSTTTTLNVAYQGNAVHSITVADGPNSGTVLFMAKATLSSDEILRRLESVLLTEVPNVLEPYRDQPAPYALFLVQDRSSPGLLHLAIGLDHERKGSDKPHSPTLYVPADRSIYPIPLGSEVGKVIAQVLECEIDDGRLHECLRRTARALGQRPLLKNATSDFVVIATDVECEHLDSELRELGLLPSGPLAV